MNQVLELKTINQLLGESFYIPHYQRGYRWTSQQVNDLLDDIWAFATKSKEKEGFYCLQPIVVKKKTWSCEGRQVDGWEVIDGQQRLTTLHIIINYLAKEFLKVDTLEEEYDGKEIYTIQYETRQKSAYFLENITKDKSNIDFYHMHIAYNAVKEWFTCGVKTKDRTDKNRFIDTLLGKKEDERSVQVIWYNAAANEKDEIIELHKSIELFARLNIGKIPLTNAELIKALFLSSSSFDTESHDDAIRMKMEVSQLWDDIEKRLNDAAFWSFITNYKKDQYATKIELLFDVIARKNKGLTDPLFTFLYFLSESKDTPRSLWNLWLSIERFYLTLCEWYEDKNMYHRVGYLIATGENLRDLLEMSMHETKNIFNQKLDELIKASVNYNIDDLNYENQNDYKKIERVLLLLNVESVRKNENIAERYPFELHKSSNWSIEHIHAQNSESLDKTKKDPWFKWLNYHKKLIIELVDDEGNPERIKEWREILRKITDYNNEKLTWEMFSQLSETIISAFSEHDDSDIDDLHLIHNLALLSQPDNAALNNSVFEVKRRAIIEMDKKGHYIPLCTRRVFLKYYNNKPSTQQYYYWGREDRSNYLKEIKAVLGEFLPKDEAFS